MLSVRRRVAFVVAACLSLVSVTVVGPASAEEDPDCTIVGTEADDVLEGTNQADVICGLGGNDVIYAGNGADTVYGGDGDDSIYGENGDDVLSGGGGNDVIYAGNGADTVYGGDGDDSIYGENGDDVVSGGGGDDLIDGGRGDDTVDGDAGDDAMVGGNGVDTLTGGPGIDSAHGGNGDDTCAAETLVSCETELLDEGGDTTPPDVELLSPADGAPVGEMITIEVAAGDDVAVAAVELLVDGIVAGSATTPDGDGIYRFDVTFAAPGRHRIAGRASDTAGNAGVSEAANVTVPSEALPSTYVVFSQPQTMSDVFATLTAGGLHPVEFEHVVTHTDGEATSGGFYAPDVPIEDQEAYYQAFHHDKYGSDPSIISVRLSGVHDTSDLGALADHVDRVEAVPALAGDGETVNVEQSQTQPTAAVGGDAATTGAATASREDWWPDTGTVYTFDTSITFALPPPCILVCPPVTSTQPTRSIVQDFEWNDQEAVDLWTSGFAYEHDFKLFNPGLDAHTFRPFCGSASDDFWASRIMIWWDSTIPLLAGAYLDTGILDDCTTSDFTVGILLPVFLDAGFYTTEIRALPGDLDQSPYQLDAQHLGKTGGALCLSKYCVNVPGSAKGDSQDLVPGTRADGTDRTVPTLCTSWSVFALVKADPLVAEHACDN